ncbi:hypothetical protein ACLOJK_012239 [Asimina triloba]
MKLARTEDLQNTASIPKSLLPDYRRLLSSMPSRRLNASKLIDNSEYFQNKLVETIQFMEVLNLKDSVEKDSFFRKLPNLVEQLPRQIVLKKLLPLLASALEFGSAAAPALTALLKMGSWLSPEDFNVKALPTIVKLFASNDRAIRVGLLQHIDQFGESLSAQIVDEQVFPHVATGFSDTSAFLRELTLKSMLVLAPKLSQRTLSGTLLKYLSKLQGLVGRIVGIFSVLNYTYIGYAVVYNRNARSRLADAKITDWVQTRKRVLINAFTIRALRDTFSPARAAASNLYSGDCGRNHGSMCHQFTRPSLTTIMNLIPHFIEKSLAFLVRNDVRAKAFQAIDQFMHVAKQYHEKLTTGDSSGTSNIGMPSIPENASLLGWAMSSLTLKGKSSDQAPLTSANNNPPLPSATSSTNSMIDAPGIVPVHTTPAYASNSNEPHEQSISESPTSTDGWGELENGIHEDHDDDKDGWDDIEPQEEQKHPPALANIQAAQRRPVAQPKQPAATARSKATMMSAKDEDDDMWGSIAAQAPKTTSKPLNAKAAASYDEDDDPWGAIAAPPPKTVAKPLNVKSAPKHDDDDPWSAIAAPPPTTKAKPLGAGRGRGVKAVPMKLGAQRINRTS